MLTSAAQAKTKLNAHFECLRQCVNEALSERLAVLLQSVDDIVKESLEPLEHSRQEIQHRVDVAVQILDTGEFTSCDENYGRLSLSRQDSTRRQGQ